jgi:hypothetical protein
MSLGCRRCQTTLEMTARLAARTGVRAALTPGDELGFTGAFSPSTVGDRPGDELGELRGATGRR